MVIVRGENARLGVSLRATYLHKSLGIIPGPLREVAAMGKSSKSWEWRGTKCTNVVEHTMRLVLLQGEEHGRTDGQSAR